MGFRSCLGILRLAKRYGDERVERACARCAAVNARSYKSVESMLKHGLDGTPVAAATFDGELAGSAIHLPVEKAPTH